MSVKKSLIKSGKKRTYSDEKTYWKARTLLLRDQVEIVHLDSKLLIFKVKNKYDVMVRIREGVYNCTCESGSLWHVGGRACHHIKACMKFAEYRGIKIDKIKR